MRSFRHVLVPIDFSTGATAALLPAGAIARGGDAELTLLHVYPYGSVLDPADAPYIPHVARMGADTREAVISGLSRAASRVRPPVARLRLVLREGDPSTEILHFAQRQDVDLIAMGTHGRRGFDRLALGSVAERVCRKSACSVLTARERPDGPVSGRSAHIVCAVDLGSESRTIVGVAMALAQSTGARLTLLHVVAAARRGDARPLERPAEPDYLPIASQAYERLARLRQDVSDPTIETDIVIAYGRRHDEIAALARVRGAAWLVVGGRSEGNAFERGPYGATVQQLLRAAPCPVLLARPGTGATERERLSRTELLKA